MAGCRGGEAQAAKPAAVAASKRSRKRGMSSHRADRKRDTHAVFLPDLARSHPAEFRMRSHTRRGAACALSKRENVAAGQPAGSGAAPVRRRNSGICRSICPRRTGRRTCTRTSRFLRQDCQEAGRHHSIHSWGGVPALGDGPSRGLLRRAN